jgi:VacB/RNase II family 3'-5' exoribonuclease
MSTYRQFNLATAADRWLQDVGFLTEFSRGAQAEADQASLAAVLPPDIPDLRRLLWSSVDNVESRDLDQIEVAERLPGGKICLRVGIADVAAFVTPGTDLENHARTNTTTVYGPDCIFPMLPESLSCGLTSLLEGEDRLAMVTEMVIAKDGTRESVKIYRALVHNYAKLDYESVGAWLDNPSEEQVPEKIAHVPGMAEQVKLQDEIADRMASLRRQGGALEFDTVEYTPVLKDGKVVDMMVKEKSQSRALIENFMVAVNTATSAFLQEKGFPTIQRVVRSPRRWSKIVEIASENGGHLPSEPDPKALSDFLLAARKKNHLTFGDLSLSIIKLLGPGEYVCVPANAPSELHFGLAVSGYTHSTAPNRRYPDIITQRLLVAAINNQPCPYAESELEEIAAHCTEQANDSNKVERRMKKAVAALLLQDRMGEFFEGIVTGVADKGVFVRISNPSVEGRIVRGERGLDVGDHVRVKLTLADPERGFIDFVK